MNIAIYNKNKITLEPIAAIGYIIGSRAKRKGPAGKAGPFLYYRVRPAKGLKFSG